jgi:hypothetical protein
MFLQSPRPYLSSPSRNSLRNATIQEKKSQFYIAHRER